MLCYMHGELPEMNLHSINGCLSQKYNEMDYKYKYSAKIKRNEIRMHFVNREYSKKYTNSDIEIRSCLIFRKK